MDAGPAYKDESYRSNRTINTSRCAHDEVVRRRSTDRLIADSSPGKENGRGGNRYLRKLGDRCQIGYQYNAPSGRFDERSLRRSFSNNLAERISKRGARSAASGRRVRTCTHV